MYYSKLNIFVKLNSLLLYFFNHIRYQQELSYLCCRCNNIVYNIANAIRKGFFFFCKTYPKWLMTKNLINMNTNLSDQAGEGRGGGCCLQTDITQCFIALAIMTGSIMDEACPAGVWYADGWSPLPQQSAYVTGQM